MSLLYFVVRVRCRRTESSRSLSHLLMSFLSVFAKTSDLNERKASKVKNTNSRFYELGINLGIVNPRLVVYPDFIPGTTFCVLSTLWNRGITIVGIFLVHKTGHYNSKVNAFTYHIIHHLAGLIFFTNYNLVCHAQAADCETLNHSLAYA